MEAKANRSPRDGGEKMNERTSERAGTPVPRVALSVSTSARACPGLTLSPSFLCHLAMLPWKDQPPRGDLRSEPWTPESPPHGA